jgi:cathepsin X
LIILLVALLTTAEAKGFIKFDGVLDKALSPNLLKSVTPDSYVIRNVSGQNYGSRVLNQQAPNVCGSCWAEAATGALSDRYALFTRGKLRVQLAPQILLNWNSRISGGSCNGGSDLKAYDFIAKYGIVDDSCQPFVGLDWLRGFEVAAMRSVADVRSHQCYQCGWGGTCNFVAEKNVELYGADEIGQVLGEAEMMTEISARGSIACSLNSDAWSFDAYHGGIITCPKEKGREECMSESTDHVIVIAGYGYDAELDMKYWIGRNSYGTSWGEGAGGGWCVLHASLPSSFLLSSPACI